MARVQNFYFKTSVRHCPVWQMPGARKTTGQYARRGPRWEIEKATAKHCHERVRAQGDKRRRELVCDWRRTGGNWDTVSYARRETKSGARNFLIRAEMGQHAARGGRAEVERQNTTENHISSGANCEKASGAASSKRVRRLRNTKRTLSVGPLRCLATWISA